jgi:hypothetical protein
VFSIDGTNSFSSYDSVFFFTNLGRLLELYHFSYFCFLYFLVNVILHCLKKGYLLFDVKQFLTVWILDSLLYFRIFLCPQPGSVHPVTVWFQHDGQLLCPWTTAEVSCVFFSLPLQGYLIGSFQLIILDCFKLQKLVTISQGCVLSIETVVKLSPTHQCFLHQS